MHRRGIKGKVVVGDSQGLVVCTTGPDQIGFKSCNKKYRLPNVAQNPTLKQIDSTIYVYGGHGSTGVSILSLKERTVKTFLATGAPASAL